MTLVYSIFSPPLFSQENSRSIINVSIAEKIYLQLASKVYAADQTIWFKAVVTDTKNNMPTEISRVLYVDLINSDEQVVEHKLVKLTQGTGNGYFELQEGYIQGRYLIRAYTQWNRNFGDDFIFTSYVDVLGAPENGNTDLIESLAMVEKEHGRFFVSGRLNLPAGDGPDQKEIKVYINWDSGQDTISVKRRGQEGYSLEYEVPDELNWITFTLERDHGTRNSETVVFNDSSLDVQFFPESGKIVHGVMNKIGFKAIGFDGLGKEVQGEVFDSAGNRVTSFESNYLGMGFFLLDADSSITYHAKVYSKEQKDSVTTHFLPPVASNGSKLSVSKGGKGDNIRIHVASNNLLGPIYVKASCRGTDYYSVEGRLRNGRVVFELPSEGMPEGIIVFTLLNEDKIPIAERLYFNESEEDRLNIALNIDKANYKRREKSELNIRVFGKNQIIPNVDFSVMVIDKNQWHKGTSETIRSRLLLTSELSGVVEDPGHYFRSEKPGPSYDLDALLLTQGWRNYKYPVKRQGTSFFWPQPGLSLKGGLRPVLQKKAVFEDVDMTLMTLGKEPSFYSQPVDSLGNFHFLLNDASGSPMRVLLQAKNNGVDKKRKYNITLNRPKEPKVDYRHRPSVKKIEPVRQALALAHEQRRRAKVVFDSLYGVTQLDEVVVEGYRLTPLREKAYKQFGEADVVIKGDMIREKEKKWSYGLYSILLFNYADQVQIERFSDGFMLAHINGGRDEPTLLVVDGRLLTREQYEFVPNMSPEIVESVELIKYAKFFSKQYLTVFPETNPLEVPSHGHIISVYTKGGVGVHGRVKPEPGTLNTSIDIFAPTKEFYTPKYGREIPVERQTPDLRSLIYWAPTVTTDSTGNASLNFYNGDVTGEYVIIIEAISKDGRIGYLEKEFSVEDPSP